MSVLTISFIINFFVLISAAQADPQENVTLPRLFYYDESEVCPEKRYYCKITLKLSPLNVTNSSDTWKAIEYKTFGPNGFSNFDWTRIERGYCLNDEEEANNAFNEDLQSRGLTASSEEAFCHQIKNTYELLDGIDISFVLISIVWVSIIFYCTMRTVEYAKLNPDDFHFEKVNKFIKSMSLLNTWRNLWRVNKNEDFVKLKSMQGLRILGTFLVVFSHIALLEPYSFTHNPEFLEEMWTSFFFRKFFLSLVPVLVQLFYVMSSWLLAVQLSDIIKKNSKITFKDVCIIALNRYFRLIPAQIVSMLMMRNSILLTFINPVYSKDVIECIQNCNENWWANLLFVQNLSVFKGRSCNPVSWYIAADTQLYFIFLIIFYVSKKFGISLKYFLATLVSVAVYAQFYTFYYLNMKSATEVSLKIIKDNFLVNEMFYDGYIATRAQVPSYAIGFVFGLIYTENKNTDIFNTKAKKLGWYLAFFGLINIQTFFDYSRSPKLIYALSEFSFKALFALGYAVGILGMATNTGGIAKKILECKLFEILANFSYCTYVFHVILLIPKIMSRDIMVYDYTNFFMGFLTSEVGSFAIGALMFFVLEFPCAQLQKHILPQVKTNKKTKAG